jgi:hypothetical protein
MHYFGLLGTPVRADEDADLHLAECAVTPDKPRVWAMKEVWEFDPALRLGSSGMPFQYGGPDR